MKRQHPEPDPGLHEPDATYRDRVEQHLKRCRPRPLELDWAAIESAAQANQAAVGLAPHPASRASRHGLLTHAGAWLCGAAAGVIVTMLLLDNQPDQDRADQDTAAVIQQTPSHTVQPPDEIKKPAVPDSHKSPLDSVAGGYGALATAPRISLDPYRVANEMGNGPLRAGSHLPAFALVTQQQQNFPAKNETAPSSEDTRIRRPFRPESESRPAMAREQLLRELLDGTLDASL